MLLCSPKRLLISFVFVNFPSESNSACINSGNLDPLLLLDDRRTSLIGSVTLFNEFSGTHNSSKKSKFFSNSMLLENSSSPIWLAPDFFLFFLVFLRAFRLLNFRLHFFLLLVFFKEHFFFKIRLFFLSTASFSMHSVLDISNS